MKARFLILAVVWTFVGSYTANSQEYSRAFGFGLAGGVQKLIGDAPQTHYQGGGEALLGWGLGKHTGLYVALGYNQLGYQPEGSPRRFATNMIYADLFLDWEVLRLNALRTYLVWGVGGFNFEAIKGKRYNDGEVLAGGGIRLYLSRSLAFQVGAVAKYTSGDDLDNLRGGGRDAYLSLRAGLVFHKLQEKLTIEEPLPTEMEAITVAPPDTVSPQTGPTTPNLQAELIALQNRIQALQTELENKMREIEALKAAIEQREKEIARVEREIAAPATPPRPAPTAASGQDFKSRYQTGLTLFDQGRYNDAIQVFQTLVERFPKHKLASNCLYWIGECYFALKQYQKSLEYFDRVLTYTDSYKLDDALLMSGRAYEKMGNMDKAIERYMRLLEMFPESEYVGKVTKYVQSLQ